MQQPWLGPHSRPLTPSPERALHGMRDAGKVSVRMHWRQLTCCECLSLCLILPAMQAGGGNMALNNTLQGTSICVCSCPHTLSNACGSRAVHAAPLIPPAAPQHGMQHESLSPFLLPAVGRAFPAGDLSTSSSPRASSRCSSASPAALAFLCTQSQSEPWLMLLPASNVFLPRRVL